MMQKDKFLRMTTDFDEAFECSSTEYFGTVIHDMSGYTVLHDGYIRQFAATNTYDIIHECFYTATYVKEEDSRKVFKIVVAVHDGTTFEEVYEVPLEELRYFFVN